MRNEVCEDRNDIFTAYNRAETIAESAFDDLSKLTAGIAGVPVCLINLVEDNIQMTIGSHGIAKDQLRPEESICRYTITHETSLEINDLSSDPRFCGFSSLSNSGICYYYGIPLYASSGLKIGALCILDYNHVVLTNDKRSALGLIAEQVSGRLEDLRRLNVMQQRLQESEKRQAALAHDIRGPLAGISSLSELAIDELENDKEEDVPLYLQHIKESGRILMDLTADILTPEGTYTRSATADLAQVVIQLKELFMPSAISKNIALFISGSPCVIAIPKTGLLQALSNLVANAIKFTPTKGSVNVSITVDKETLVIIVDDTGVGISQMQQERLFLCEGCSTDGTAGEKGSGLGLVAVYNFAKGCHGNLFVRSVVGKGSQFKLTLPLSCDEISDDDSK